MRSTLVVFVAGAVACTIAHVGILRSVVRSAVEPERAREDVHVPRPTLLVELVWAAIPMLVLAIVLTATWARIRTKPVEAPQPVPVLEVAR